MRSIGIKNIATVKRLTLACINQKPKFNGVAENYDRIEEEVIDLLPNELWDTWEMADTQIRQIVRDTIWNYNG